MRPGLRGRIAAVALVTLWAVVVRVGDREAFEDLDLSAWFLSFWSVAVIVALWVGPWMEDAAARGDVLSSACNSALGAFLIMFSVAGAGGLWQAVVADRAIHLINFALGVTMTAIPVATSGAIAGAVLVAVTPRAPVKGGFFKSV